MEKGFTLLQTYKVLKHRNNRNLVIKVLHSYKLTRFSNTALKNSLCRLFYTLTNLQGSQTTARNYRVTECFTLLQTYKVLKHWSAMYLISFSFTLLQTYKVLKHVSVGGDGFN